MPIERRGEGDTESSDEHRDRDGDVNGDMGRLSVSVVVDVDPSVVGVGSDQSLCP